jgi:hypothetical protein
LTGGIEQRERRVANIVFFVERSHILMFARALGDTNPAFIGSQPGEDAAVEIVAPPTFPQAVAQFDPSYHLRPKPGEPWFGSAKQPSGIEGKPPSSGSLHAEQHFEYRRPLRPGDVLTVDIRFGDSWEKAGKRGGRLLFRERITEYRDQAGELVVSSRAVVVSTEWPAGQG